MGGLDISTEGGSYFEFNRVFPSSVHPLHRQFVLPRKCYDLTHHQIAASIQFELAMNALHA